MIHVIEPFSLGVMVEALRTNIDWKSPFLKGAWVTLAQNFRWKGMSPTNYLCTDECLITLQLKVFTQRNFVADFLQEKPVLYEKRSLCDPL